MVPENEGAIPSISLDELRHSLVNIKSPAWREVTPKRGPCHPPQRSEASGHSCTLQSMIEPILSNMTHHMKGCEFGDFNVGS
jgi:hypothetical protein